MRFLIGDPVDRDPGTVVDRVGRPAVGGQPRRRPFRHPAPRQRHESSLIGGMAHDLDTPAKPASVWA
jgi:hypothetical protein